ncbi:MAG TPA: lipid A biosynthesis acyltransferase [Tenacibaculum sp.]|nr:lipid A biosynthesis acyltransferase [Tenacibaculum sp.]
MNLIIYVISYPFIWIFSLLPMRVLYWISDFIFILVYYLIRYRKNVVRENLKLSFPDKKAEEIERLTKKFFRHFIDVMMESVKTFSISKKEMLKRFSYKNPELVNSIINEGNNIVLVGAHLANWEWSVSLPLVLDINIYGTYSKLANPYFDKRIKKNRTKFGLIAVKTSRTIKNIHENYHKKVQSMYLLLSDQSPMLHKTHYWRNFFHTKVPVHTGAEIIAKKYNFSVVNYTTKKIRRGYYETEFSLITNTPKDFENYQLTDRYFEIVEKSVAEQPECYLWTHKRYKHKDKYNDWLKLNRK